MLTFSKSQTVSTSAAHLSLHSLETNAEEQVECTQRIAKRKQNTRERTTLLLYVKHKDEANEREALYEREYTRYMFECECLYPIGGSLLGNHISTSRAVQNARSVRESEWCKRNTHARESLRKVWRVLTFVFFCEGRK